MNKAKAAFAGLLAMATAGMASTGVNINYDVLNKADQNQQIAKKIESSVREMIRNANVDLKPDELKSVFAAITGDVSASSLLNTLGNDYKTLDAFFNLNEDVSDLKKLVALDDIIHDQGIKIDDFTLKAINAAEAYTVLSDNLDRLATDTEADTYLKNLNEFFTNDILKFATDATFAATSDKFDFSGFKKGNYDVHKLEGKKLENFYALLDEASSNASKISDAILALKEFYLSNGFPATSYAELGENLSKLVIEPRIKNLNDLIENLDKFIGSVSEAEKFNKDYYGKLKRELKHYKSSLEKSLELIQNSYRKIQDSSKELVWSNYFDKDSYFKINELFLSGFTEQHRPNVVKGIQGKPVYLTSAKANLKLFDWLSFLGNFGWKKADDGKIIYYPETGPATTVGDYAINDTAWLLGLKLTPLNDETGKLALKLGYGKLNQHEALNFKGYAPLNLEEHYDVYSAGMDLSIKDEINRTFELNITGDLDYLVENDGDDNLFGGDLDVQLSVPSRKKLPKIGVYGGFSGNLSNLREYFGEPKNYTVYGGLFGNGKGFGYDIRLGYDFMNKLFKTSLDIVNRSGFKIGIESLFDIRNLSDRNKLISNGYFGTNFEYDF